MTKEEYDKEIERIESERRREIKDLELRYALENNSVDYGDIVTDSGSGVSVLVQNIIVRPTSTGYPCCVYGGKRMTKKLTPFKNDKKAWVYQIWVKTHIKKADIKAKG